MSFSLSVFDILSNAIPGSMQLTWGLYVLWRMGVLEPTPLLDSGVAVLLLTLGVGISIVLGHLMYVPGRPLRQLGWRLLRTRFDEVAEFRSRNERDANRVFVDKDTYVVFAAVQLHDKNAAGDVIRLRAESFMLVNSTLPLATSAVVAAVEVFASNDSLVAAVLALVFAAAAVAAMYEGLRLRYWSRLKTLEFAAWVPDIDNHWH